jgi:hypothetical protein
MTERRNLLGALGVALVSLGLGAILSLGVLWQGQHRRFDWGVPIVWVAVAAVIAGALIVGGILWRFLIVMQHRKQIDAFVKTGQLILEDLQDMAASLEDSKAKQRAWTVDVLTWVQRNMPHYAGHIDNLVDARGSAEVAALWRAADYAISENAVRRQVLEEVQRARMRRLKEMTGWQ